MDLADRTVLLTGATGGLGPPIARALVERGVRLVLTGRRTDVLDALAGELHGRAIAADLSQPGSVRELVVKAGAVDVLVSNAALPASGYLDDFTEEQIDRALDVNLRAPVVLTRLLLEPMVRRGSGHIAIVGSLGGKAASPAAAIYSATKFGLRGFAHALREDLHGTGVGVSLVLPGPVRDAGMWADARVDLPRTIGTRSPVDVAEATIDAIERDRAEIVVATPGPRVGASLASLAPGLFARLQRRTSAARIMAAAAAGQRDKR
jgi:uncharacterized protein